MIVVIHNCQKHFVILITYEMCCVYIFKLNCGLLPVSSVIRVSSCFVDKYNASTFI